MSSSFECHPELARHIGARIRTARLAKKLSRPRLAALVGAHRNSVFFWERGEHQITATRLTMIAAALEQPIGYFTDSFAARDILPPTSLE
jgi:transcriptional regulator with XRE-family HTH domain